MRLIRMTGIALAVSMASHAAGADEADKAPAMGAEFDEETGRVLITDAGQPVLAYNYATVPIPDGFLEGIPEKRRKGAIKYGVPRSDYIHPLYGPGGEELTHDWSKDHAHHRGIYWAWPEVQFGEETGDLHALQRVWARPTGKIETRSGEDWAEVEAESRWMWEDQTPIVREVATIRAWRAGEHGRCVDLTFQFEALEDGVTLARRKTNAYGGLNIRLAPVSDLKLIHHADPGDARPRMAWQAAAGAWPEDGKPIAMAVLENKANPGYPGDYVEYPDLPWFQPTFPKAGERFALVKGRPLVLRYRVWIRSGPPPTKAEFRGQWKAYHPAANEEN